MQAEMDSYDPRQRRRRGGHTVALVVAALAIPGAIAGVVALAGNGGGDRDGSGDPTPEEESYAMAALEGDGYSYAIPTGWEDATDWAHEVAPSSAESAVTVEQSDDGFGTNVLVTAWDASGPAGVAEARKNWYTIEYGQLERLESVSLDGEQALGLRWEGRNEAGRSIVQVGYLAFWNDRAYSVVLSAPAESEADYLSTFDELLDSWSWDESATLALRRSGPDAVSP